MTTTTLADVITRQADLNNRQLDPDRAAGLAAEALRGLWHVRQALEDLSSYIGGDTIQLDEWEDTIASAIPPEQCDADAVTDEEWSAVFEGLGC